MQRKLKLTLLKVLCMVIDNNQFDAVNLEDMVFGIRQKLSLLVFFITVITVVYGAMKLNWGMTEMSCSLYYRFNCSRYYRRF